MKENVQKNTSFLDRHDQLKAKGLSLADMQAIICEEFNITGHSYRAWKSRLNLQYNGRYKARIAPYLWQPKLSIQAADVDASGNVVLTNISVDENLQMKVNPVEVKIQTAVLEAN